MSIDLKQFHQTFFEESLENLDSMEQGLLALGEGGPSNCEVINTIFRAAHSIKGGSGTFGFTAISDFTHILETLLDEAREGRRALTPDAVDLLLKSSDCLREMIHSLQSNTPLSDEPAKTLVVAFENLLSDSDVIDPEPENLDNIDDSQLEMPMSEESKKLSHWRISFKPQPYILMTGNEPLRIFRELNSLGKMEVEADTSGLPDFDHLTVDECHVSWTLLLTSDASKADIEEVFDWVIDQCNLTIESVREEPKVSQPIVTVQPQLEEPQAPAKKQTSETNSSAGGSSIRVGIDKIDSLINLVGELVITQSMLSELGNDFQIEKIDRLTNGLEQLLQNTKELQESVMRIRMLPISFAFNRFPRMIRDLATKMNKKVDLQLRGENTELDKTVMEQIGDPLVHLVRNAIDHGIEPAEDRIANGKSETGTIQLEAYHQGGNIVIEIQDDGRGIDSKVILQKAIDKGLVDASVDLSESRIFDLIFEPGFSTAEVVSDISGRGVGMDVVRRNINALGGRIEIESELGKGSTFKVHLPLTLAIVDGQLIRVGTETYIIPLTSIVESVQIKKELINRVSGDMALYRLREDNVPIIPLYKVFGVNPDKTEFENGLLVVVEGDGQKIGLLVDDLLAQQQVVIKSLESNYKRVEGISGATILGDGSVSMILDVPGLVRQASEPNGQNRLRNQPHAA